MFQKNIQKRPLSEKILATLHPKDRDYRKHDGNGLYILIAQNDTKFWQFRYKNADGKWAWIGIGTYPQISLLMARHKAHEYREALAKGEDLKALKRLHKQQNKKETLYFQNLMCDWLNIKVKQWGEVTYNKAEKSIYKHLIPAFGGRDYVDIPAKEWFEFFQGLQRNLGIHTQVEKLVAYVRSCYDWAKFQGKINSNPIDGMMKYLDRRNNNNMRFIEIEEMPVLLERIRTCKPRAIGIGLELMILLFPRPSELRFARWEHFDLQKALWTKPAETTKTRQLHQVPLSHQAIQLLKELKEIQPESDYLFPGRGTLHQPISNMTFNTNLNKLGYEGRQHPHGFRHLASTVMNEMFSHKGQVIEACLAHKKKGVKAIYDKAQHLDERRVLMQWWADFVNELEV